jgi:hypothetical protein
LAISRPVILDVGGGTGAWSEPYRKALYDVRIIDPLTWPFLTAQDAAELDDIQGRVRGILLAPPCTEFAGSGARWWATKPPHLLTDAVQVVRDMLHLVALFQPEWWALENPVGRLAQSVPELGRHQYTWQPWEYGDPEVKRTCMWGMHTEPTRTPVPGPYTARVHLMAPSANRAALRSITPSGFANAFFEANP